MTKGFLNKLARYTLYAIFIYAAIALWVHIISNRYIFLPANTNYKNVKPVIYLKTNDGVKIAATYLPNPKAKFTILYSHGNAENLERIWPQLKALQRHGYAVFAYDYHGYGLSNGKPSESAAYLDINAAYHYLTQRLRIAPNNIIALGRSLGSGPSIELARHKPLAGIILENAFISTYRVLTHYPLFIGDKFQNLNKISEVKVPILIIHSKLDEFIPFWHSEALYAKANTPKQFLWVHQAGHNNLVEVAGQHYWKALNKFTDLIQKHKQRTF